MSDDVIPEPVTVRTLMEAKGEALKFLQDYFPDKADIMSKTRLTRRLIHLLSAFEVYTGYYSEFDDVRLLAEEYVNHVERRLISEKGESRTEFMKILQGIVQQSERFRLGDDGMTKEGARKYFDASND